MRDIDLGIDEKQHGERVAYMALQCARVLDWDERSRGRLFHAGLLHDLGKLGVPDEVLDKPGRLNREETAIMHRHSYDTYRILHRIDGLEEIAQWAGNHHETLLGDGYPFHHRRDELPLEARVLVVADIFQALAQDRPYRGSLDADSIISILQDMADAGHIDAELVALARHHREQCWQRATGASRE